MHFMKTCGAMIKSNLFHTDTAVVEKFIQAVVLRAVTRNVNTQAILVVCKEIGRLLPKPGTLSKFLEHGTVKLPMYNDVFSLEQMNIMVMKQNPVRDLALSYPEEVYIEWLDELLGSNIQDHNASFPDDAIWPC